jgi:hypothetical protein
MTGKCRGFREGRHNRDVRHGAKARMSGKAGMAGKAGTSCEAREGRDVREEGQCTHGRHGREAQVSVKGRQGL